MKTYQFSYCKLGQRVHTVDYDFHDDDSAIAAARELAKDCDIQVLLKGRLLAQVYPPKAKGYG